MIIDVHCHIWEKHPVEAGLKERCMPNPFLASCSGMAA